MLTTLLSSFYPLYTLVGRKFRTAGKWVLFAVTECCSFIGFKNIVATVYPALGIFGMAMTVICAAVYLGKSDLKRQLSVVFPSKKIRKNSKKISVKPRKTFDRKNIF